MTEIAKVTAKNGLHLRKDANARSEILATLPLGTEVTAISKDGNWLKVNYLFKTGFIYKDYVALSTKPSPDIDLPYTLPTGTKIGALIVLALLAILAAASWLVK